MEKRKKRGSERNPKTVSGVAFDLNIGAAGFLLGARFRWPASAATAERDSKARFRAGRDRGTKAAEEDSRTQGRAENTAASFKDLENT